MSEYLNIPFSRKFQESEAARLDEVALAAELLAAPGLMLRIGYDLGPPRFQPVFSLEMKPGCATGADTAPLDLSRPGQALREALRLRGPEPVSLLHIRTFLDQARILAQFPFHEIRPEAVICDFNELISAQRGFSLHTLAQTLRRAGYGEIFVSQWHPSGSLKKMPDRWFQLTRYPSEPENQAFAGRLLAFRRAIKPTDLAAALNRALTVERPREGPEPLPEDRVIYRRGQREIDRLEIEAIALEDDFMAFRERQFLCYLLRRRRPRRVLEVGVAFGGTTRYLFQELDSDAELFSVDIARSFAAPGRPARPVGHEAETVYQPGKMAAWRTFFGHDVSACLETIAPKADLDFCILDTTHAMPGEILSFLAILPYLKDGATVVLHDIGLDYNERLYGQAPAPKSFSISPLLLFSAVKGQKNAVPLNMPNIGAFTVGPETRAHMADVFRLLFLPWDYWPGDEVINDAEALIAGHYPPRLRQMFTLAVNFNRELKHGNQR